MKEPIQMKELRGDTLSNEKNILKKTRCRIHDSSYECKHLSSGSGSELSR